MTNGSHVQIPMPPHPTAKRTCDPVTLAQLQADTDRRVAQASKELHDGLSFVSSCQPTVTIFGSAMTPPGHPEYAQAERVAARIVRELDYAVVTGGAGGIMEAANKGAREAKGVSVGLTIQLPREQMTNGYLSHHVDFYYFFTRKVALAYSAEAYLFFPGGFGTHDELFEILTLIQTHKMERHVPIILVGTKFWTPLATYFREHLLANGKVDPEDPGLVMVTDDEDLVIETIRHAPIRHVAPRPGSF